MAGLHFDVTADNQNFIRKLREIEHGIENTTKQAQIEGKKMDSAFNIGDTLKKQIHEGSQSVNGLTSQIIKQKAVIKDIEHDVRNLGEAYRRAGTGTAKGNALFADFKSAKSALQEEKTGLFDLQTQQAQARLSVRKLKDEYSLYQKGSHDVIDSNNNMALSFKKALGVIGGVAALKQLGSEIIKVRGEFQSMQTAIETLVGKNMAGNLIPQIKELAKTSPLTLSDMVGAEKMMLGFNIKAEDTIRYLQALGDISMGNSQKFNSLTLAFSQMSATGKLMGQDLNQMINAGFNPLQTISEKTGKSIATLKEEMSKGAISTEMVQKAFIDATSEGGRFFGMSENASKTINGQLSMMQDALDEVFNEIGTKGEGAIMSGIQATTSLIQNYETVGKVLTGLIATYGTYKAATIAYYAITKTYGVYDITTKELQFVATMKNIVATKALTVQQALLNKTMLSNPYVLVATLVVGAAAAMWALHDSTTAAEKAQSKFNDELDKFKQKEEERKQKTESLIRTIQDETETELAKVKAYEELQRLSPALTDAYKREELAVASLADTNKELNKVRDTESYDNIIANIDKYSRYVKELQSISGGWSSSTKSTSHLQMEYPNTNVSNARELANEDLKKWQEALDDYKRLKKEAEENSKPVEVKLLEAKSSRDQIVQEYASAKLTLEEEQRKIQESGFGVIPIDVQIRFDNARAQLANIDKVIAALMQGNTTQTYKEAYNTAQREWKAAQKALEESKKKSKSEYIAAKKDLDDKEKAYKDLGGSTNTSKQESSADKLRKEQEKYALLLDKQSREQKRMEEDSANELEQLEIDRLKEGSEKVLRQRKLNHDKEIEEIKREAQEKKAKAIEEGRAAHEANPDEKKKPFSAEEFIKSEPVKKQFASFDNVADEKTKTANTQYNRGDDLSGLLNEYQDYTDKRLAIEAKFNNDLAVLDQQRKQAVKNGDAQQVEQIDRSKAQATKDKGMELMGMDYEKLKETPDYVRAFENLKETSSETLNSLLSQFENAKTTAAKVLSPDQLREYTSTIQSIMDELDSRNPFQSLSDKKKELAEAEEELAQAQVALENARQTAEAVKGGAKIENGVKSSKFNQKTGKIDSTKAYLSEAQALEKVKDKTENYNEAKDKAVKKSTQVQKAEKKVTDVIGDLSDSMKGLGSAIGGQAGDIINLIGDIGNFTMMAMSGVQMASTTASTAIQTVEKASVILAIISAAVQIATKIFDMFGKDTTTEKYEDAKEAYESYISILDRVIEKQLELAATLTGDNANAAYKKAIEMIKLQSANAKTLGQQYLNSGASRKSHSKGYEEVDDMSSEGWDQAARALGMRVDDFKNKMGGRMAGLFDLTDEQLAKLQSDAGIFWSQLDSDTQKYADQIADGVARVAKAMEQQMADTTLIDVDSLRSDFQDLLTDMDNDSADFADNFEGYMKDAILNSMLKDEYMGRLTKWREKFYNAMNGGVTKEEYDALKAEGQQLSEEMAAKRDLMKELYGWTGEDDDEREASKKGIATASQDSVDELNGRFAVIQGHTYSMNEGVKHIQSNSDKIVEKLMFLTNIDKNMSDMLKFNNSVITHLSNISSNTSRLETIEKTMESIRTGIDTLNIKGLKLQR